MNNSIRYYYNWFFRYKLKLFLQLFPWLYVLVQRVRFRNKKFVSNIISKDSDIVIEGFPRSANSFSVRAFRSCNDPCLRLATHLHAYPQIILGIKLGVPSMMLIREPLDCISSYAAFKAHNIGIEKFKRNFNVNWFLQEYIFFYSNLKTFRNKILVVKFKDAITDYGMVLDKLNTKFNTDFISFNHNDDNVRKVFETSGKHLSPSHDRDMIKTLLTEEIAKIQSSKLYLEAIEVYKFWT